MIPQWSRGMKEMSINLKYNHWEYRVLTSGSSLSLYIATTIMRSWKWDEKYAHQKWHKDESKGKSVLRISCPMHQSSLLPYKPFMAMMVNDFHTLSVWSIPLDDLAGSWTGAVVTQYLQVKVCTVRKKQKNHGKCYVLCVHYDTRCLRMNKTCTF